jgi:hypothetical protein
MASVSFSIFYCCAVGEHTRSDLTEKIWLKRCAPELKAKPRCGKRFLIYLFQNLVNFLQKVVNLSMKEVDS